MLEATGLNFLCDVLQLLLLGCLFFNDVESVQPIGLVCTGPKAGIAIPQALHLPARLPVCHGCFDGIGKALGQGSLESAHGLSF